MVSPTSSRTTAFRILMVCMGNICRSPTAEGVLRHKLAQAGLADRVEVDSAGTHGWHAGAPPDDRAQAHARRRGYELGALRARALVAQDFERFDLILAMDADNLAHIDDLHPAQARRARTRMLLDVGGRSGSPVEVPDPYYGGPAGFDQVLDLVEQACDALVDELRGRLDGTS